MRCINLCILSMFFILGFLRVGAQSTGTIFAIYWDTHPDTLLHDTIGQEVFASLNEVNGNVDSINVIPSVKWIYTGGFATRCWGGSTFDDDSSHYIFLGGDSTLTEHLYTFKACDGQLLYHPAIDTTTYINLVNFQYVSVTKKVCAICWNKHSDSSESFVSINPYTGAYSLIDTIPGFHYLVDDASRHQYTFNSDSNQYITLGMDNSKNVRIYTINAITGQTIYSPVFVNPNMFDLQYDSLHKKIYGIFSFNQITYIYSVNQYNGSYSLLDSVIALSYIPPCSLSGIPPVNTTAFNSDSAQYVNAIAYYCSGQDTLYSYNSTLAKVTYRHALPVLINLSNYQYGHTRFLKPIICSNDTICSSRPVTLSSGGGTFYSWCTGATTDSITVIPAANATFSVNISNGFCSKTLNVSILIDSVFVTTACCSATITKGQSVGLNITSGAIYYWCPVMGLNCDTCQNPVASPMASTWYKGTVTSKAGCKSTDSVLITVDEKCGDLFVPNAFSPNGDGQNDLFLVKGNCVENFYMTIFDRWGNKLFESQNINDGWDGTYKDHPMNTGTYVYYLKATMFDKSTVEKKGTMALVR